MDDYTIQNVIIPEKLREIEQKENVRILHCVESGSRAWGFPSPDSDFDVRFIYVRPKEYYLRLDKTRDVIEWQLDETLDINGWDLKKALVLLYSSNPTLFEWNHSPVVYKTTDEWQKISAVINRYFQEKSGLYHYFRTAQKTYAEHLQGETVRLKKYFYVLRPLLACRWILCNHCPPPMRFAELVSACLEPPMQSVINELLERKMHSDEFYKGKRIDVLNAYLESSMAEIEKKLSAIPADHPHDWETLNRIFLETVLF